MVQTSFPTLCWYTHEVTIIWICTRFSVLWETFYTHKAIIEFDYKHTCSLSSVNFLVWRQKNLLKQYYTICIFIGHNFPTPNQWFVQLQIKWCKRNAMRFLCLILEAWNLARTRGVWVAYQWGYCLQCEGIDARHVQWQDGYQENSLHQDTILQLP